MADEDISVNMDTNPLGMICHDAHKQEYAKTRGCSGCVKYFAYRLGVFMPNVCDYNDGRANALIDFMNDAANKWTKLTKDQALFQAKAGKLVVGGKKAGVGHVVVILPAIAEPKNKWGKGKQSLVCCSMTIPGTGYAGAIIDANATVWNAWGSEEGVEYWLAPDGPSACAGKPLAM